MAEKILIVDDEIVIRDTLQEILRFENYDSDTANNGEVGLEKFSTGKFDVVICDVKMPIMDGIELLERGKKIYPNAQFIMVSGHGTIETAVETTKKGAFDFIEKPPDLNRLLVSIRNAKEIARLAKETNQSNLKVFKSQEILGNSTEIKKIKEAINRVAPTEARILISGGNGTRKEFIARRIHLKSPRAKGPLIEVNCAAIPSKLIESELFGLDKGSFEDIDKQRIGKFEQANGGTLFLDEIGALSLSTQAKVLRVLNHNKITRLGSNKQVPIDIRIITATNKDLQSEIEYGNFKEELYHRLSVILIHIPDLKDRRSDIPLLIKAFLKQKSEDFGVVEPEIESSAISILQRLEWPGNDRELYNVIERLIIMSDGKISKQDVLEFAIPSNKSIRFQTIYEDFDKFYDFVEYAEKEFISRKLEQNHWDITKTTEVLGIQESQLIHIIEKYALKNQISKDIGLENQPSSSKQENDLKKSNNGDKLIENKNFLDIKEYIRPIIHNISNHIFVISSLGKETEKYLDETPRINRKKLKSKIRDIKKRNELIRREVEKLNIVRKKSVYKKEKIDTHSLVKETANLLITSKHSLIDQIPEIPCLVIGDKNQLSILFGNIIENALQAMLKKGNLTIKSDFNPSSFTKEQAFVEYHFIDEGVGIKPKNLNRLFDYNFTTKEEGHGIGLYLAKQITERHGGKISISSIFKKGTEVIVSLPIARN